MLYISSIQSNNLIGITDSIDGITEYFDKDVILNISSFIDLEIKGLSEKNITPINYMTELLKPDSLNAKKSLKTFIETLDFNSLRNIGWKFCNFGSI